MTLTNIPIEKPASNSDATLKVFNQYFQSPINLNNNDLIATVGFFEKRGFGGSAAENIAIAILTQAKKDGFNAMQIIDTLSGLDNVQISSLVAEILNYNRLKTSAIGVVQLYGASPEVLRNIVL
jgi:hypothetical protein